MSFCNIGKFHNVGSAFVPRPKIFITAIVLASFLPPELIVEVSSNMIRPYPPLLLFFVDWVAIMCYMAFLTAFVLCFGLRAACVVGFSAMGVWSIVASIASKHESRLLDSLCLALPRLFFYVRYIPLGVMGQQMKGHWNWRSLSCLFVVVFVGSFSGVLISLAFPEWALTIYGLISFAGVTLFSMAFPKGTVSDLPLEVRDWGLMGGCLAVLSAHTFWLNAFNGSRTELEKSALSVLFFSTCGFYLISIFWDIKRGRTELWELRKAALKSLWEQAPQEEVSEKDKEAELAGSPSIV